MSEELTLTELMGARFCHDLAGPISAVNNGLEFLREDNTEMKERALELIEASSREAVVRLQFFRQAYGIVSSEGEADISHLKDLTQHFFALGKITLDWPDQHTEASGISISHRMGRLILNLIIINASSLIYGGTINVRLTKFNEGYRIIVTGSGKDIKVSPEVSIILENKSPCAMDKRNVQVHFTARLARQLGVNIQAIEEGGGLKLVVERIKTSTKKEETPIEGTALTSHV